MKKRVTNALILIILNTRKHFKVYCSWDAREEVVAYATMKLKFHEKNHHALSLSL